MIDCNGYSLPTKPTTTKNSILARSNLMAAYPAESALSLDRKQGSIPRDFDLYSNTYPRKSWHSNNSENTGNYSRNNNIAADVDPRLIRGILRNKGEYTPVNTVNQILDESYDETEESESEVQIPRRHRGIRRGILDSVFESYIRPTVGEFLCVLFTVFTVAFMEATMEEFGVFRITKIAIVSVCEGLCFLSCMCSFQNCRIHMNPAITLGALFAGDTKPMLCFIFWVVQIVAATLGVFLFQVVTISGPPVLPALLHAEKGLWLTGMYKLVLCQTIATAMLVMSYLTGSCSHSAGGECTGFVEKCAFHGNSGNFQKACGVSCAVILTSFLSLLSSTASWNPARSLATCLSSTFHNFSTSSWTSHYVFWLGPIIGSLFASFFYRLVFADQDHRIASCGRNLAHEIPA